MYQLCTHDEPVDHKHGTIARALVRPEFIAIDRNDGPDRGMGNGHVGLANREHGFSSKVVNEEHRWNGKDKVDNSDDTRGEKPDGVASQADLLEDGRGVVDDSVDSGPLLVSGDEP